MATPHVNSDTFICGTCQKYFNDLVNFLEHKRSTTCGVKMTYTTDHEDPNGQQAVGQSSGMYVTVMNDGTISTPNAETSTSAVRVVKKRGRPRKSLAVEQDENQPAEKQTSNSAPEEKSAIIGQDGSMTCNKCKQKFKRERHFKSHKCKGIEGDLYVKPEDIPELEDGFDSRIKYPIKEPRRSADVAKVLSEENVDHDETEDYKPDAAEEIEDHHDDAELSGNETEDGEALKRKRMKLKAKRKRKRNKKIKLPASAKKLIATYPIPQTLDDIPDIPVFPNEESRLEFEKKEITVVDLSQTDNMYKTHVIEQTMNENAFPLAARSHTEISLYSCNQCEKVFKSLSHIRYHCLTHIDNKPFKCPEDNCDFRANCKGNIYSHMRKHTGQLYRCRTCEFKSVNKTHLLEHEATHSDVVHKCALCSKDYSTVKSLINHVRKYHAGDKEGKDYLAQFIATKEGPGAALLYECHICDRKFKKQSDRDRHLYVHNVRVEHTLYTCELCQYETSKPAYLDSHFIKHKFVYGCELCDQRFVSVQAMLTHITEKHGEQLPTESEQFTLSEASLERSLYLPEEKQSVIQSLPPGQQHETSEELSSQSIYDRLGYEPMTVQVYNEMREKYGSHECPECGNLFLTEETCDEHLKTHEGEKPFNCKYCNHSTYSKNSLKLHINANHEDQLFRCDKCDFVSKGKVTLMEHKQRHEHMECPICKQIMPGRKALRNHLLAKHGDVDAESARRLSGYGRRTDAMKSGKAFKCPYCEKTFLNNNTELQKHLWTHEGIKPFKCNLCDYSCRTRSNLTSHMLRHTEYKPFPCVVCGKKYKSKTALRWHERSHATGKLFKCDKCNYEATQKSHLVRHLETHNIQKRFSCNHCYFSANTLGYMRIHYTRFHPGMTYVYDSGSSKELSTGAVVNQPANVYKCVSCDYLFGNLSDMKRHLRMRHRIHIADMRQNKISDTVTQIVPMENQDGITSDVQIIQFPMEEELQDNVIQNIPTNVIQGEHSIIVGEDGELTGSGIQLVELSEQTLEAGGQQVIVHYTGNDIPVAASNFTIDTTDTLTDSQTGSDVIIQTSQEGNVTILRTQPGVSLLKSVHLATSQE